MPGPTHPKSPKLPPIPSKHYFTIGEVSTLCEVKSHVLRYWEQEFDQLKPVKRRGNRRYYQPHEVQLIRDIRGLLYDQGFTISGARAILESKNVRPKLSEAPWADPVPFGHVPVNDTSPALAASHLSDPPQNLGADLNEYRSALAAMAGLISGTSQSSPSSLPIDLSALKLELQSILELLQSD
jgi:DNA-binding transcriptional MerR regulator